MKMTKSPFLTKLSYDDQPNKIHFNRKQSLQFEKGSVETIEKEVNQNYLSSYPIFQATKSKIIPPPVNEDNCEQYELQRKKSSFLINYHQKLKRQRKRQLKLKSSIKQLKITKCPPNQATIIDYSEQHPQSHLTSITQLIPSDQDKKSTSILILQKTPFLDTSVSVFRQRKDYSKDSTLQLLLKQINDIKMQEKKQIQKINQRKIFDQQSNQKISNKTKQIFFTKYQRGFLLPMRRKIILSNGTMSKTKNLLESLDNSLPKYESREKKGQYKKTSDRAQLERLYNFKQIDPWENLTQRQYSHSFDSHFLFSTVQN